MPRLSNYDLPSVNPTTQDIARLLRETRQGRVNTAGGVTLASGATSTIVVDRDFSATTVLHLMPRSAAAAAIKVWHVARAKGQITLGHDAPGADVDFYYTAIG